MVRQFDGKRVILAATKFIGLTLAIGFAMFVGLALIATVWHIWLAGHGRTSWVDETRVFPVVGESTALDLAVVLISLALGLAGAWKLTVR